MSMVKVVLTFRKADGRNLGPMPMPVRIAAVLALASALGACATVETEQACQPGEERMRTAQLFFGRNIDQPPVVTEVQFRDFVAQEITPRFPEGLTVFDGAGQWQEADGDIIEERSKVVVLLYPREASGESHAEIEAIRAAYEGRFGQDAVLRADDERPICASL